MGWKSTGSAAGTAWSASGGGASILIDPTVGSGGTNVTINCASTSFSGKVFGPDGPAAGTWVHLADETPVFSSCTVGSNGATVSSCANVTNDANSADYHPVVVTGQAYGFSCSAASGGCGFSIYNNWLPSHGSYKFKYDNDTGKLSIVTGFSQTLGASWDGSPACNALFGTTGGASGVVTISSSGGGDLVYNPTASLVFIEYIVC